MKKLFSAILLIIILCTNLSSCIVINNNDKGDSDRTEKKYTKIELTIDNFQEYLSFETYTKDAKAIKKAEYYDNNRLVTFYDLSWTAVVEVFPTRSNCTFENVKLLTSGDFLVISLDGYGYATVQKNIKEMSRPYSNIPSYPDFTICIVQGYVYVYDN